MPEVTQLMPKLTLRLTSPAYKLLLIANKLEFETGKLRSFFVVNIYLFLKSGSAGQLVVRVFIGHSRMTLTFCCEPGLPPHGSWRGFLACQPPGVSGWLALLPLPLLAIAHNVLAIPQATRQCLVAHWSHRPLNHREIFQPLHRS